MILKLLATFALFLVLSTFGCSSKPEEPTCRAEYLLLDVSVFPSNVWDEIGSRDSRDAPSPLGIERAGTSFSTPTQGVAVQVIYRFATVDDAEKNYAESQVDWFNLAPNDSTWLDPIELKNIHLAADRYRLDCSQDVIETCRYVGLYRTYVVELKADMPSLTYNDFIHLLEQIDKKMRGCVGN